MFWFFGHEACGILAPHLGIKPALSALKSEVLTTRLPRKSVYIILISFLSSQLVYSGDGGG